MMKSRERSACKCSNERIQLEITYKELQMLRRYLLIWRNKLLAQGHITDPVDELLVKLG